MADRIHGVSHRIVVTVLMIAAMRTTATWAGEGFGVFKDSAVLNRTHPPRVFIQGTGIAVQASAQNSAHKAAADRMRSLLESELLSADSRLSSNPTHPDTIIEANIVEDDGSEKWENRSVTRWRDTGQKDKKGKPVLASYDTSVRFEIVKHRLGVAYKVQDAKTRSNLDADTLRVNFENEFEEGNGAPDQAALEAQAIQGTVKSIRARLAASREQIGVLLPRGRLKDLANFAKAGLWNQYLEAVQGMPALSNPADEAYRQYALGLGYEALGYAAESHDDTLKYLQQAAVYYNQALQGNPGEKYFSLPYERFNLGGLIKPQAGAAPYPSPHERVRAALVDYQRVKEFASVQVAAGSKAVGPGVAGAPASRDTVSNRDVIDMVKAGLTEDVVLATIDSADGRNFDVSPKGLIELTKAKVSKTIIRRIQAKVQQ